ncbi:MAG: hypothetical protein U5L04_00520 [Trueperaceae bacterium]|nr:hypothetical protein [Trueperaceae bacterium]
MVLSLVSAGLGLWVADWLVSNDLLAGPINIVYLSLVGFLIGYLVSAPLAHRWDRLWRRFIDKVSQVPPEAVLAAGTGVTVALIITVLLNSLLEQVPGFTWYWSLLITLLLVIASSWFFVVNRHMFVSRRLANREEAFEPQAAVIPKVIDTSAIIDGRIVDIVEANFLDGEVLIPRFILSELQNIADSSDPLRRRRGRRGLEMLDRLVQQRILRTEVIGDDFADVKQVDDKLVQVCTRRGADLITTDYNLNRVAALQGVRVLNVNQLANAVKVSFLPGERLSLHIVREGREPGQGLAYLEDGTMVVVEDAANLAGNTIDVVVTSSIQTNMGRMIFARLPGEGDGSPQG